MANVTFDGPNYLIIVDNAITSLDVQVDLYSDWKEWFQIGTNAKYYPAFRTVGGDPAGGGKRLGDFYFLQNQSGVGWQIRPYEGDHTLILTGNIYPEDPNTEMFVPTVGDYTVLSIVERSLDVLALEVGSAVTEQDKDDIADRVWDETMADHLTDDTTGKKLYDGGTGDAAAIAAAVWDELLTGHDITGSAGEYLTEFYNALQSGEVYVASSTAAEITMVRDKLGDAGIQVTETITDEEAISESTTVVFPAERMIYSVTSVYLASDPTHASTEYYGATGSFDSYTGAITLETALPGDNTPVLINYTMMRGLPDTVIDWFLDEAKLYIEDYTKQTFTWSDGLGVDPDIRTRVALYAAISYAGMRCLESIATGDIVQLGYEFKFGDLEVNNQVTGGFHVQAHIDLLKDDVNRKLAILGRKMTFVMRSTKQYGRGAWGYKRSSSGRRTIY